MAKHMFFSLSRLGSSERSIVGSLGFIVADPLTTAPADVAYFKSVDWDQPERQYNFSVIQEYLGMSGLARKAIVNHTEPVAIQTALAALTGAYKQYGCTAIWGTFGDICVLRDALGMYKMDMPWDQDDERDIVSVWSTLSDLGIAPQLERGVSEPENVPLGDAAFIGRMVATVYQGQKAETPDRVLKEGEVK